jgi:hypothetical protein
MVRNYFLGRELLAKSVIFENPRVSCADFPVDILKEEDSTLC